MIIVESGRNPFSVFLLGSIVLSGVSGLLDPAHASNAVARLLPHWELWIWYSGLVAAGGIALGGIFSRGVTALVVERVGLSVLGVLTCCYVAAVMVATAAGSLAALVTAGLAVACFARVLQISRDLRRIDRTRANPEPTAEDTARE